ncbi:hypothetical protein GCM10011571_26920 [Marinithermofilum abyssi]|uniref:Uncharacterized protein n=1 Tax=Marinithermofilum abyssi TaxID=1571185 RepID=A0A8J2VH70_9BACL|nr:hypothetical protein GCM10011571_26920 [Marinithermofilum abyssi]
MGIIELLSQNCTGRFISVKSVIMLRDMNQLPLATIGWTLHLPVTPVKTRVHRGKRGFTQPFGFLTVGHFIFSPDIA